MECNVFLRDAECYFAWKRSSPRTIFKLCGSMCGYVKNVGAGKYHSSKNVTVAKMQKYYYIKQRDVHKTISCTPFT